MCNREELMCLAAHCVYASALKSACLRDDCLAKDLDDNPNGIPSFGVQDRAHAISSKPNLGLQNRTRDAGDEKPEIVAQSFPDKSAGVQSKLEINSRRFDASDLLIAVNTTD